MTQLDLQRAKVKRAKELVLESSDMNPGDASVMFLIAAVMMQQKYCEATLDSDLEAIVRLLPKNEARAVLASAVHASLVEKVRDVMVAVLVMENIEKAGGEI